MSGLRGPRRLSVWNSTNSTDPWMQVGPLNFLNLRYVLLDHHLTSKSYTAALQTTSSVSKNIFNNLFALEAPTCAELQGELDRYLATDPVHVTDALAWWYEQRHVYPRLHRMALDYLSIPGTLKSHCVRGLLTINHIQSPQLTLNELSVRADSYCHIYVTAFLFN